jgi:hypothetical protein
LRRHLAPVKFSVKIKNTVPWVALGSERASQFFFVCSGFQNGALMGDSCRGTPAAS